MGVEHTSGAVSCADFRPAALPIEMERVPVVFDSIYNPGERGEEEEEEEESLM